MPISAFLKALWSGTRCRNEMSPFLCAYLSLCRTALCPCDFKEKFIMRLQKTSKTRPTIEAATMIDLKQKYDASTVAVMRQALNEIVTDRRFLARKSVTPLEVAEHILQQAASGERDLSRLKSSAFEKLSAAA
jgi:hypothetical protein